MNTLKHKIERTAFSKAFDVAYGKMGKDRQHELKKMFDMAKPYIDQTDVVIDYDKAEKMIFNENGALIKYIDRFVDELDKNVLKTAALNFGFEAMFCGTKVMEDARKKYECNVPWLILMDPTSACNLHCTGCWAAEYGNKLNLSFEDMDDLITQGKELGIYFYMYTGGEPLVRKEDLIRICEKHRDCAFIAFTNGTLVDQAFCDDLKRVGNLYLAISLEGTEDVNDQRRGEGVYKKVMGAMDLLKENGCLFGTSICYTSSNYEKVTSDDFIQMEIDKGVKFSMYFHYMPVGNDASPELLPTKEQRTYMYHRIRKIRDMTDGKGLFCFDFQNDGEYVGGCIAGGRNYFHVNAGGDAEPCVFIHYSNANIKEKSLLEVLHSPIFMAYHDNQPFNNNPLRPCPMLENPDILPQLVRKTGAKSTDLQSPERVESLCAKCHKYAESWGPEADKLWKSCKKTI
ncbi:pyrroloquinoline quinone biosynthesis protein PqqE [uncultured Eubacterium sp.]|nr:pyrroloquinoline quinone biosynthesis protein PqqE [uncultured Eubacterium sp.]